METFKQKKNILGKFIPSTKFPQSKTFEYVIKAKNPNKALVFDSGLPICTRGMHHVNLCAYISHVCAIYVTAVTESRAPNVTCNYRKKVQMCHTYEIQCDFLYLFMTNFSIVHIDFGCKIFISKYIHSNNRRIKEKLIFRLLKMWIISMKKILIKF